MKLQTDSIRFQGGNPRNITRIYRAGRPFRPYSSHITSDLDKIADYIAYIHEGRLLFLKSIDELNNDCGIIRCGREFFDALSPEDIIAYREEPYSYCVFIKNRQSLRKAFCDISIENASIEDMMLFYSKGEKII